MSEAREWWIPKGQLRTEAPSDPWRWHHVREVLPGDGWQGEAPTADGVYFVFRDDECDDELSHGLGLVKLENDCFYSEAHGEWDQKMTRAELEPFMQFLKWHGPLPNPPKGGQP